MAEASIGDSFISSVFGKNAKKSAYAAANKTTSARLMRRIFLPTDELLCVGSFAVSICAYGVGGGVGAGGVTGVSVSSGSPGRVA